MRIAEKIILMAGIGREVYEYKRMQHLFSAVAMVAVLTVIAATLLAALVMIGLYVLYLFLLAQQITPLGASAIAIFCGLFIVAVLVSAIRERIQAVKSIVRTPGSDIMNAFLDGLFPDRNR